MIGNLARDVVEGRPRVGGGPFHAARALRLLGRPARVVAKCAAADRPTLLAPLVALGVPVEWSEASESTRFSFRYEGERRVMWIEATGEPWRPDEAAAAARGSDWVHVAPLTRADFPAATIAALAAGRRLSLDGQGLVRPARTGALELDADYDPAVLRGVSILKLAEDEAAVIAPDGDLAGLGVPEVVVTLGSSGALVVAGGRRELVTARPVRTRDPTGAGDAFAAAYLTARAAGQPPVSAARAATAIVAAVLSR